MPRTARAVPRARRVASPAAVRLPALSEADFQRQVMDLAARTGWLRHHIYDSRRAGPDKGFPDLVLARRDGRLIYAELKRQRGRTTPEQEHWLAVLATCPSVEVYIWRPSDWPAIVATLTRTN